MLLNIPCVCACVCVCILPPQRAFFCLNLYQGYRLAYRSTMLCCGIAVIRLPVHLISVSELILIHFQRRNSSLFQTGNKVAYGWCDAVITKRNKRYPVDTGRQLNVHNTSYERLMYVQFTSCVYWVRRLLLSNFLQFESGPRHWHKEDLFFTRTK